MPSKGTAVWVQYVCLDGNNRPLAGDVANHTVYWTADDVRAEATNNQGGAGKHVELGNGAYEVLLTVAEATCDTGIMDGVSATSGAVIVPRAMVFGTDTLAVAVPGSYADGTAGAAIGLLPDDLDYIVRQVALLQAGTPPKIAVDVHTGGVLNITAGADYTDADGTALLIPLSGTFPKHNADTCSLAIGTKPQPAYEESETLLTATGTFVENDDTWYASFDLTTAETAALSESVVKFEAIWDLYENLPDGGIAPIFTRSKCWVTKLLTR